MNVDPARLPIGHYPTVHIRVREREGDPDSLYAVTIDDDAGDQCIRLSYVDGHEASLHYAGPETWWLVVGHNAWELHGYQHYVGNICWDKAWVTAADARRLVSVLIGYGFDVEEVAECALMGEA